MPSDGRNGGKTGAMKRLPLKPGERGGVSRVSPTRKYGEKNRRLDRMSAGHFSRGLGDADTRLDPSAGGVISPFLSGLVYRNHAPPESRAAAQGPIRAGG